MIAPAANEGILTIRLDKSSRTPVYLQIAEEIRALLKRAVLPAGTSLPPERVLCERYEVSRMTLRQAIDLLARDGLIETQRGRGTFVAPKRLSKQQQQMRSFTEEIRSRGGVASSHVVSFRMQEASLEVQEFFGGGGQLVYEIKRLRYCDGDPLALETVQIPCRLCPNLDRFDLARHSLYQILEENYGLTLTHCVEEISAAPPERLHRKLLGQPSPAAVLVIRRKTYTLAEVPVEFAIAVYRGDAYSAIVRSVRVQT